MRILRIAQKASESGSVKTTLNISPRMMKIKRQCVNDRVFGFAIDRVSVCVCVCHCTRNLLFPFINVSACLCVCMCFVLHTIQSWHLNRLNLRFVLSFPYLFLLSSPSSRHILPLWDYFSDTHTCSGILHTHTSKHFMNHSSYHMSVYKMYKIYVYNTFEYVNKRFLSFSVRSTAKC